MVHLESISGIQGVREVHIHTLIHTYGQQSTANLGGCKLLHNLG